MHILEQCIKSSVDIQDTKRFLQELGQVFSIRKAAIHVSNDLEFSKFLARILAQALAKNIPYTVIAKLRGLLSPFIRTTVLYRHCDGAGFTAGTGALSSGRCTV